MSDTPTTEDFMAGHIESLKADLADARADVRIQEAKAQAFADALAESARQRDQDAEYAERLREFARLTAGDIAFDAWERETRAALAKNRGESDNGGDVESRHVQVGDCAAGPSGGLVAERSAEGRAPSRKGIDPFAATPSGEHEIPASGSNAPPSVPTTHDEQLTVEQRAAHHGALRALVSEAAEFLSSIDVEGAAEYALALSAALADAPRTVQHPEVLPCKVALEGGVSFGKGVRFSTFLDTLKRRAANPALYAKMDGTLDRQRRQSQIYLALRWAAKDKAAFDAACAETSKGYAVDFGKRVLRGSESADEFHGDNASNEQRPECVWRSDTDEGGVFDTGCGRTATCEDDPRDCRIDFCCYCGKSIRYVFDETTEAPSAIPRQEGNRK
jgi:hypothetical protein